MKGFFMSFDFILLIILKTNLSKKSKRGVIEVVLSVYIEKGLSLRGEATAGDHLCGIEGLTHGHLLKVFDIGVKNELVVMRLKNSPTEVLDLYH